jgi:dihydroxyacid dehydratase/phosphogluconate dehydratase
MSPEAAARRGLTSTVCFPVGNLAPEGSVIKSTAIDPSVLDPDGVYRFTGPAKVFASEPSAMAAIKEGRIQPGDVLVLVCRGPMGSGMEETYQLTSALRYLEFGKRVAILTDARFSGVSTGACIGHVSPEALAGGPIAKVQDGDLIEIVVDRRQLEGSVNLVGERGVAVGVEGGTAILARRAPRADLAPDPLLPADTRLWAALQDASGGTWGGSVYDVDAILKVLDAGRKALQQR